VLLVRLHNAENQFRLCRFCIYYEHCANTGNGETCQMRHSLRKSHWVALVLCCATLFSSKCVHGAAGPAESLRFEQLNVEQGLPQEPALAVYRIAKVSSGSAPWPDCPATMATPSPCTRIPPTIRPVCRTTLSRRFIKMNKGASGSVPKAP
jgi:hypothetical protein